MAPDDRGDPTERGPSTTLDPQLAQAARSAACDALARFGGEADQDAADVLAARFLKEHGGRVQEYLTGEELTPDDVLAFFEWLPIRRRRLEVLRRLLREWRLLLFEAAVDLPRQRELAESAVDRVQQEIEDFDRALGRFARASVRTTLPWNIWEHAWGFKPRRFEVRATLEAGCQLGEPWGIFDWGRGGRDALLVFAFDAVLDHMDRADLGAPIAFDSRVSLSTYLAAMSRGIDPHRSTWVAKIQSVLNSKTLAELRSKGREGRWVNRHDPAAWIVGKLTGTSASLVLREHARARRPK